MKVSLSIFLSFFLVSCIGQAKLQLLKQISEVDPSSSTGITQKYNGNVCSDGNLYFTGVHDGFHKSLWKSDGTPENTAKFFDEESFSNWISVHYIPEGIITLKKRPEQSIEFYSAEENKAVKLISVPDDEIKEIINIGDSYLIFTEMLGSVVMYKTDLTPQGTEYIAHLGEDDFNTYLSASKYAAINSRTINSVSFVPSIHNFTSGQTLSLVDYFASFKDISQVEYAYVYDKYIFTQVVESGVKQNYVFDLESETFFPFAFLRQINDYVQHNDLIYLFTNTQVVKFNTSDMTSEEIFRDVSAFNPILREDNKTYFVGERSNGRHIYELDLSTENIEAHPETFIINNPFDFHVTLMKFYNDEFYYTSSDEGQFTMLYKYDFDNRSRTFVDTISINSGITIEHAMEVVDNNLIVSKYSQELGHELYFLDINVSVNNLADVDVQLSPNPAVDYLSINHEAHQEPISIDIIDTQGRKVMSILKDFNRIELNSLSFGQYYAIINFAERQVVRKFIKSKN